MRRPAPGPSSVRPADVFLEGYEQVVEHGELVVQAFFGAARVKIDVHRDPGIALAVHVGPDPAVVAIEVVHLRRVRFALSFEPHRELYGGTLLGAIAIIHVNKDVGSVDGRFDILGAVLGGHDCGLVATILEPLRNVLDA